MDAAVKRLLISMFFPTIFLLALWIIFISENTLDLQLVYHGLYPRKISGLQGIVFAPLIHGGIRHIFANSLPLFALGSLLFYFYQSLALRVMLISYILPGIAVWFIGRASYHVGASGIIYSLAAFLFLGGLLRKHAGLMAVSLVVWFQYGTMVWGVLPIEDGISWESHLCGMITGLALAWISRKKGPPAYRSYAQGLGHYTDDEADSELSGHLPWDEYEVEGPRKNGQNERDQAPNPNDSNK